jgi:hypothetical protein
MLDGKPVFPVAMAMELMAEAACAATMEWEGGIEMASLQVQRGIVLEDGRPIRLQVSGIPASSAPAGTTLSLRVRTAGMADRAHYRADVTLGLTSPPPHFDATALADLDPFPLSVPEAYRQWLFQGPCFAGITAVEGIRRDAIAGMVRSVAPRTCLPVGPGTAWRLDPTVVDASLQLVILWERHWHDMTPLPVRIGRFRLFEPLSGQPVRCVVTAATQDGGEALTADIAYTDTQGRLLAVMEGLQCACTQALNRLSDSDRRRPADRRDGEPRLEASREDF